jgi:hypothetical protein
VLSTPPRDGVEPVTGLVRIGTGDQRARRRSGLAPVVSVVDPGPASARRVRTCRGRCGFGGLTEWHHHRLLTVLSDPDVLLDLFELAVTWAELDYSSRTVIPPHQWMSFHDSHQWSDPRRAERIFSIATDVATTATRAAGG